MVCHGTPGTLRPGRRRGGRRGAGPADVARGRTAGGDGRRTATIPERTPGTAAGRPPSERSGHPRRAVSRPPPVFREGPVRRIRLPVIQTLRDQFVTRRPACCGGHAVGPVSHTPRVTRVADIRVIS